MENNINAKMEIEKGKVYVNDFEYISHAELQKRCKMMSTTSMQLMMQFCYEKIPNEWVEIKITRDNNEKVKIYYVMTERQKGILTMIWHEQTTIKNIEKLLSMK